MKRFCFDLDCTLVNTVGGDYKNSTPIPKAIEKVRRLYADGNIIIVLTARGTSSKKDYREFTLNQLNEFGIPFHELIVGLKPSADYFIDDKAVNAHEWLEDEETALARVVTVDHVTKHAPLDPFFPYAKSIIDKMRADGIDVDNYLGHNDK